MAFQDVELLHTDYYDLVIGDDGDFVKLDSFDTALQISLIGSDRRASATEEPIPQKRRGWIGNQYQPVEYGSKLWLLYQARLTNETVNRARTYCQQALQWLVDLQGCSLQRQCIYQPINLYLSISIDKCFNISIWFGFSIDFTIGFSQPKPRRLKLSAGLARLL